MLFFFFFFKQKTAYEMRISDWSSDVCSSDLVFQIADWAHANVAKATFVGAATLAAIGVITLTPLIDMRAIEFLAGITGCIGCVMLVSAATAKGLKIGRASCRERVCQYV